MKNLNWIISVSLLVIISSNSIIEINDDNYYNTIYSSKDNWIVVFYALTSITCFKALENTELIIYSKKYEDFKFASINCNESPKICMTYEIKQVPLIMRIKNEQRIFLAHYPNLDNIQEFMNADLTETELSPVLELISQFKYIIGTITGFIEGMDDHINKVLIEKEYSFRWKIEYTIISLVALMIIMILVEVGLIKLCFRLKRGKVKKIDERLQKDKEEINKTLKETEQAEKDDEPKKEK